ncbi:MAG: hypothetical protein ACRDD2_00140 [Sarcina sp.]
MGNAAGIISSILGSALVVLVIVGTVRLIGKARRYNPDNDLNDIERFFDENED